MKDNKVIIVVGSGLYGKTALIMAELQKANLEGRIVSIAEAKEMGVAITKEQEEQINAIKEVPKLNPMSDLEKELKRLLVAKRVIELKAHPEMFNPEIKTNPFETNVVRFHSKEQKFANNKRYNKKFGR